MVALAIVFIASTLILPGTFHNATAQIKNNEVAMTNASIPRNPIAGSPLGIISPFTNITTSIPVFPTLIKALRSEIHVSLNDATTNAMKAVGSNSSAVTGSIQSTRGFLVYTIIVLDSNNNIHLVMVDPGNGKVVSSQQLPAGMLSTSVIGLTPSIGGGFISPSGGYTNFSPSGIMR
jgi:hypothetical protein